MVSKKVKQTLPYYLVYHPPTQKAAVYNRWYELIDEYASAPLLRYAEQHHTRKGTGFSLSQPEQQPAWLTEDLAAECINYNLYTDASLANRIKNLPRA